jgi:putative acetyltransferase
MIRSYRDDDAQTLWKIYYDTTHIVNGRDYTREQCERWAPSSPDLADWGVSLRESATFVAVDDAGDAVGFAQLGAGGEICLFYCRYDRLRQGIGKSLYAAIENEARARGFQAIAAYVSVSAKQFF